MATPPMITCTRCDSAVPWGPYCPECSAYLEFAGDPPWDPKAPAPEPEAIETIPVNEVEVEETAVEETVVEVDVAEPVVDVPAEFAPLFRPEEPAPARRSGAAVVGEITGIAIFGAIIVFAVGQLANWWVAGALGVFVAGWCALLLGSWLGERQPTVAEPEVFTVVGKVDVEETRIIDEPIELHSTPLPLEARAPQELPSQVVERTVATATRTVQGDTPCVACGQLNEAIRIFCDWCGEPMPDAVLQPEIVTVITQNADETQTAAPKQQRRLTRSWRTPIIVFSLIGVFLSAVIFALFGPNSFRVQFGMTQVFQSINQFINPTAGTLVTPVGVKASSTLEGTQPLFAAGGDVRTFWASAPSQGFGQGTVLEFDLGRDAIIDRMTILPGIQGSQFGPRALASPKDIRLTFADGTTFETELLRVNQDRDFRQLVEFPRTKTNVVVLDIVTIYPPSGETIESYGEVAISGVEFISPPVPPQFLRLPTELQTPRNLPGS